MKRPEREPQRKPLLKKVVETFTRRGQQEVSPSLQNWQRYIKEQHRHEREEAAQEREQHRQAQLAEQRQQKEEKYRQYTRQKMQEQRRRRELITGEQIYQELINDLQQAQIDKLAKDIKKHIWRKNSDGTQVKITKASSISITEQDNGIVKNRTQVNRELSYSYKTTEEVFTEHSGYNDNEELWTQVSSRIVETTKTNTLSFGIGYFGNRSEIIPEAQASVSDKELEKGVKSYFIQPGPDTPQRKENKLANPYADKEKMTIVFPYTYPGSFQTFIEHLYANAVTLSPSRSIRRSSH